MHRLGVPCALLLFLAAVVPPAAAQEVPTPFVASDPATVARMIRLAGLKDGEVAIDLGSGDGRIVIEAVRANPGIRGWGVDINAKLVEQANAAAREQGVSDRARFFLRNAFDADLRKVDVIFLWLLPELQRLLRTKILAEARPGTRVVSHYTDMGTWQPDVFDENGRPIRLWVVPAKIAGNWSWKLKLPDGERTYAAVVEQHFQRIEGAVRVGANRVVMDQPKLRGREISFRLSLNPPGEAYLGQDFVGTVVRPDRIEGTARVLMSSREQSGGYVTVEVPWRAARVARSAYFAPTGLPAIIPMSEQQ